MECSFKLLESTVFFSFLRMVIVPIREDDRLVSIRILRSGTAQGADNEISQKFNLGDNNAGIVEAMIDRAVFPDYFHLEILSTLGICTMTCRELVDMERAEYSRSSLEGFLSNVAAWRLVNPGVTPKVLDIGGRARSGYLLANRLEGCAVTVLDILPDAGVDVVADIHGMSAQLAPGGYDFLICVSVFEHLVMPWKAAIEINKVLSDGAIGLIQTHQTVGLHDLPWDYFRFSDQSWKGLFNHATGFEIIETTMTNFVRITPMRYFNIEPGGENSGGFYESSVVIRKTGPTTLEWPVGLTSIVETMYPA